MKTMTVNSKAETPHSDATCFKNRVYAQVHDLIERCNDIDSIEFSQRFDKYHEQLVNDYIELYGNSESDSDAFTAVVKSAFERWLVRPERLRLRDRNATRGANLYNNHEMVGASCYIDLFAGDIQGMISKIPYLKSLGITYLYLLPPFKVPQGGNDGGFAVTDYKTLREDLGTMDDMEQFISLCHDEGIHVVLDFVFNHTADDHEWALKAQQGDPDFEDYYLLFEDEDEVQEILKHVEATFPDKGENIVFNPKLNRWVWTTFNLYQWDLNYHNPKVLEGMLDNVLFLGNVGVDVLRLDAVSLVWKEKGTSCMSRPQIQTLVRLFSTLAKLAAPSLQMKSEAIVRPQEIAEYVDENSATLAYRPLLSSVLWHGLASGNAELMAVSMERWSSLPEYCTWVNYIRSHDDVPWVFSDLDIQFTGADAAATKLFLDTFYSGEFRGSFAKGLPFMRDKDTGLARISGTTASLAGLEHALQSSNEREIELAIQRIVLLHSIFLSIGGLPLLYLGDEFGVLNDYSYTQIPTKKDDSRWVNRPATLWAENEASLEDQKSIGFRVFNQIKNLIWLRKSLPALGGADLRVIRLGHSAVFAFQRGEGSSQVTVISNLSAFELALQPFFLNGNGLRGRFQDKVSGHSVDTNELLRLKPYETLWLTSEQA